MVPYNFDMTAFGGGSGFGNEFHPSLPIGHEQTAALHANGALGVETNNVVTNITGASAASPGLSAYATVGKLRIKDLGSFALEKRSDKSFLAFRST